MSRCPSGPQAQAARRTSCLLLSLVAPLGRSRGLGARGFLAGRRGAALGLGRPGSALGGSGRRGTLRGGRGPRRTGCAFLLDPVAVDGGHREVAVLDGGL